MKIGDFGLAKLLADGSAAAAAAAGAALMAEASTPPALPDKQASGQQAGPAAASAAAAGSPDKETAAAGSTELCTTHPGPASATGAQQRVEPTHHDERGEQDGRDAGPADASTRQGPAPSGLSSSSGVAAAAPAGTSINTDSTAAAAATGMSSTSSHDGSVPLHSSAATSQTADPRWLAPEALARGRISRASDVFAFAMVMWEMLTWQEPYAGMSITQVGMHASCRWAGVCHEGGGVCHEGAGVCHEGGVCQTGRGEMLQVLMCSGVSLRSVA